MALATKPRPGLHELKRHGGHHRRTKRYLHPYLPYLPMLVIVGMGLLLNGVWSSRGVLGTSSDLGPASLLSGTNSARAQYGEGALRLDQHLSQAAQAKADDMVRSDYWSHDSPAGKTPWAFITGSGYHYKIAGENLAYGFMNSQDSVAGWMNSPEHRANILNAAYRDVGFGVASSPDFVGQGPQTVVVAEYGQPAPAGSITHGDVLGAEAAAQPVSRLQILTGGQPAWSLALVISATAIAGALFILRHSYKLHRWVTRGEAFITKHPVYDLLIVLVITAGCVLTRVGGIVR